MKIALLTLVLSLCGVAEAKTTTASYYVYTDRKVTAARGCNMYSRFWVWRTGHSSKPYWKGGTGHAVTVVTACGRKMKTKWNRDLDLSTGSFKLLFGSLKCGTGKVSYKLIKKGYGRFISP